MGKGLTNICSPQRKHCPDCRTGENNANLTAGNSNKSITGFLGFEYRWAVSHKGKDIIVRRTSRSKLRKSITAFTEWCRENRHNRIKNIVDMLNAKLRGYFNYYGVIGNRKWKRNK